MQENRMNRIDAETEGKSAGEAKTAEQDRTNVRKRDCTFMPVYDFETFV